MKRMLIVVFCAMTAFLSAAPWYTGPEVDGFERYSSTGDMSGWFSYPVGYEYFAIWLDANPNHGGGHGHALFLDHECLGHSHAPAGHQCPTDGSKCPYIDPGDWHHTSHSYAGYFSPGTYWFWFDNGDFQIFRKRICASSECYPVVCVFCGLVFCGEHSTHDCLVCPNRPECVVELCSICGLYYCTYHGSPHGCDDEVVLIQ